MKMCFEGWINDSATRYDGNLFRFYDDYTWIIPSADGGIDAGGDWEIVDDQLYFKAPTSVPTARKAASWKVSGFAPESLQRPFREWRARLELQVAAIIVGATGGGNNY